MKRVTRNANGLRTRQNSRPRTADRTELFFTHALRSVQNGCNGPIAAAIDSNKTVTSPERVPAPTPSVSWLAGYVQIWMMTFSSIMKAVAASRDLLQLSRLPRLLLAAWMGFGLLPRGLGADWPQYRGSNHDGISTDRIKS